MRVFTPILGLSLLAATTASAADTGTLTAGKPAGVRAAQSEDISPLVYFGVVAVGIGIALAVTNGNNPSPAGGTSGGSTTVSTSTTV
jgi:hypothetical protein